MRFNRTRKRIKYVGRRYSIRALLLFLMLAVTTFFFFQSPYFNVSEITIEGNTALSADEAVKLSGVTTGINIFRVDTESVKEKMLLNPFVSSVSIVRDLPHTIKITVLEYVPVAVVPVEGGFMQVSKEGYCLRECSEISSLNLPVISGLGIRKSTPPGEKVKNDRLPLALQIIDCCTEKSPISEIDVHDTKRLNMFTFTKTKILLGNDQQLKDKISLALDIASKVPSAEYIDVRFPKSPVYK